MCGFIYWLFLFSSWRFVLWELVFLPKVLFLSGYISSNELSESTHWKSIKNFRSSVHFPVKFMVVFQKSLTENELIWKHFSQDILIDSSVYEIFKICFILQEGYQEKVFGKKWPSPLNAPPPHPAFWISRISKECLNVPNEWMINIWDVVKIMWDTNSVNETVLILLIYFFI